MQLSSPLRRLLRIRELEEEQKRLALEASLREVRRLRSALELTARRGKEGRLMLARSANSGTLTDRIAGLEEMRMAGRAGDALRVRLAEAEKQAVMLRESFIATRALRRQAETLVEERETRAEHEEERRRQQGLDDWHRSR